MESHYLFIRFLYRLSGHLDHKYPYLDSIHYLLNNYRHKYVMQKIHPYLCKALNRLSKPHIHAGIFKKIIWVFWWQGFDSLPLIVEKCIRSIEHNSGKYKVILLSKYNVKNYARMPKYIYVKALRNNISHIEFSDILRYNLLKFYGGLWIDPTNYCTSTLSTKYFVHNKILISVGCNSRYNFYISNKWAESLIGGTKGNPLFIFMNEFFKLYWYNNDYLISYNLVDYALYYAYIHNIGNFKYYVNAKIPHVNPQMFKLTVLLNKLYNPILFHQITSNTNIFKLTYKQRFSTKKDTFYLRLINNLL